MRVLIALWLILFSLGCDQQIKTEKKTQRKLSNIWIEDILLDSILSTRTIDVIDSNVYYGAQDGRIGAFLEDGRHVSDRYHLDSIYPSFRSSAFNGKSLFYLSIESPTLLYKIEKNQKLNAYTEANLVYKENHPKAFYDSMDFWDEKEGIAIGDPTDNCMSIIITRDGGETWTKLSCEVLPKIEEGEAAFAASDTNIAIVGDHTWVATGGKASRVLYSPNRGKTWDVFNTPIAQGKETTGIYSIDFYDAQHGFAIGGDYTKPDDSLANKIRTSNGGKTWKRVADGKSPGYRSCVQYIPGRKGRELVAVGFKGIDYSDDAGEHWTHLSDESFYTIRFLNDTIAYAAGKGRISKLTFRE
ncbi:WD40/YVTN/BNR-like repeat-containing protein [Winogradskyella aurantia]|uniref:Oxidoreductase n=1 Tax=Winogradskyella aurantia TaxID=1915063 RepID=A0A265US95_9FLAO|nr:oxidoreductase [Winogradskyella aurantia]OZV68102.1 oxidoreductase [Winogradskyella aurantia]